MASRLAERYLAAPPLYLPPINLWSAAWLVAGWRKAERCEHCRAHAVENGACLACGAPARPPES